MTPTRAARDLDSAEARARQLRYGRNDIDRGEQRGAGADLPSARSG